MSNRKHVFPTKKDGRGKKSKRKNYLLKIPMLFEQEFGSDKTTD